MHVSIPVMALQSIPDNTESSELPRNGKHAQYRWLSIAGERVSVPLSPSEVRVSGESVPHYFQPLLVSLSIQHGVSLKTECLLGQA